LKKVYEKDGDITVRILTLCKESVSKEELVNKLSLSNQQLRRHTAELVDQGLLHLDPDKRILVTTEKGLIFLDSRNM
jgi:predicted ArsR family transcriptional regulator